MRVAIILEENIHFNGNRYQVALFGQRPLKKLLNSNLLKGPNFLTSIIGILLHFQRFRVASRADDQKVLSGEGYVSR